MINIATIDQQVSQQGSFCLIDWLLMHNFLNYADYELWRYGKKEVLDELIKIDLKQRNELVKKTELHCQNLGLVAEPQVFHCWNQDHLAALAVSHKKADHQKLSQRWLRPQDQPQLDLFMDNSAQMTEHQVLNDLSERQFEKAQQSLNTLSELNPDCPAIGGYQDLINYGLHILTNSHIDTMNLEAEYQGLKCEVVLLAKETLGILARDYLSFAWRRLANNMATLNFNSNEPTLHISSALIEIPDYPAIIECLHNESNLYQEVLLLEKLTISYYAIHQQEKALLICCLMMELNSEFTEHFIESQQINEIYSLWQDFWEENDHWSIELFPAYLLIKMPALVYHLNEFKKPTNQATLTVAHLIKSRIQKESEIDERKNLQTVSPELLTVYLRNN